jgi:hypothetical protein
MLLAGAGLTKSSCLVPGAWFQIILTMLVKTISPYETPKYWILNFFFVQKDL